MNAGKLLVGDFVLGGNQFSCWICRNFIITLCSALLLSFLHQNTEKSLNSKACNLSVKSFNLWPGQNCILKFILEIDKKKML